MTAAPRGRTRRRVIYSCLFGHSEPFLDRHYDRDGRTDFILFTDDPALRTHAATALRLLAPTYLLSGVSPLIISCLQATGRRGPAYLISLGTIAAVRIPTLLAFSRFGPTGVLVSFPVAEFGAAALALWVLHRHRARAAAQIVLPCQAPPPGGAQS